MKGIAAPVISRKAQGVQEMGGGPSSQDTASLRQQTGNGANPGMCAGHGGALR